MTKKKAEKAYKVLLNTIVCKNNRIIITTNATVFFRL